MRAVFAVGVVFVRNWLSNGGVTALRASITAAASAPPGQLVEILPQAELDHFIHFIYMLVAMPGAMRSLHPFVLCNCRCRSLATSCPLFGLRRSQSPVPQKTKMPQSAVSGSETHRPNASLHLRSSGPGFPLSCRCAAAALPLPLPLSGCAAAGLR